MVRLPYTTNVHAKSARCSKYSPGCPKTHFPSGSSFQLNKEAVSTGLIFVNITCTQLELTLPILIENNKIYQITLPKERIGFSSLEVTDKEERKYQVRNPYELTNAIITAGDKYKDCFLLNSTTSAQSSDDCLRFINGTGGSELKKPPSIAQCISGNAKTSKGFVDLLSQRSPGLRNACRRTQLSRGHVLPSGTKLVNGISITW